MSEGTPSPAGRSALQAEARPFVPQQGVQKDRIRPIKTGGGKRDVFASLDAVCFTPSQGVCTPSPTNMAAMWAPQPFQQAIPVSPFAYAYSYSWDTSMASSDYGSPGPSDSQLSDASGYQHATGSPHGPPSRPHTPHGPPLLFSSFYYPVPFSPTALQVAAAYPGTPTRGGVHGGENPFGGAPGAAFHPSPGHMAFSHAYGDGGAAVQQCAAYGGHAASSQQDMERASSSASDLGSGEGSMGIELTPGAHQLATALLAAQNLHCEPPQQLLELASLLQTYGLVAAGVGSALPASPEPADQRGGKIVKRQKSAPKLNPDGSVRLNARQRRTLRRAQERALKAMVELQQSAHGIDAEEAAANLATMPVLGAGLGSPGPAPIPSPEQGPRHTAVSSPIPAPMPMQPLVPAQQVAPPHVQQLHPIPPAYAAVGMMGPMQMPPMLVASPYSGHHMMGGPEFGSMVPVALPMAMAHGSPRQPSPVGRPAGGPRSAPRLSRFAPVAAC